jgi:tRNA G18 (ribose-2'-O)-methylase SpoU
MFVWHGAHLAVPVRPVQAPPMRGYFGIGVEGVSKRHNIGALFRTAHGFGASFLFTVGVEIAWRDERLSDTSAAELSLPVYEAADAATLLLPKGCVLIGVEITEQATELPSFRHPRSAAYVLGSERGGLSPSMLERCAYTVRIPTRFSLNLSVAGAIVMYDRMLSLGRFAQRPVATGGQPIALAPHRFGKPVFRGR